MRIIWLKTGPLHPLDTGGKIRTYNMLRALKRSHEVTYVSLCPLEVPETIKKSAQEYCHRAAWIPWQETHKGSLKFFSDLALNQFGSSLPYVICKYRSLAMATATHSVVEKASPDLIICDFLTPAVNLFPAGRKPKTPLLLFQHNVEALIWKRLYEKTEGAVKRFYFKCQWRRMQCFERDTCARFDGVVGVSPEDCNIMRHEYDLTNVLGDVPTGVDCESYAAAPASDREPHSLVFLGSMDWMPNIDAVEYFTSEIWPAVRQKHPEATFTIVGRNPPAKVREMEQRFPGVRVTGTVDDVKPFLNKAAAMIVPLRVGGGTRIKIFEGMATGIPVISTQIGAEGLPVKHGENILLADTPAEFVGQISALFENPSCGENLGAAGRTLVQTNFGWDKVSRTFEEYCRQVVEIGKKRK